jgi:hypothetical protein
VKDFGRSPGRLANLEPAAKGVYSLWMSFALLHFGSSFAMYWERTLRDRPDRPAGHLAKVAQYYAGNGDLAYPKQLDFLLQITHQHLFAMPLTLLVASHLYLMTRRPITEKRAVIAVAAASMTLHVAAPWIVRYGGEPWAWVMPVTGIPFGLSFAWMVLLPIRDMWLPKLETTA